MSIQIEAPVGATAGGGRSFSVAYRLEFLRAWDECVQRGAKTRLLRRHGLSRNTVDRWLRARRRGDFSVSMTTTAKRSRNQVSNEDRAELARLRRENERLRKKVADAEAAQEILGKAFGLLEGITTSSTAQDPQIPPALMSVQEYAAWLSRHRLS